VEFSYEKSFAPNGGQETDFTAGISTPGAGGWSVSGGANIATTIAGEFKTGSNAFNLVENILTVLNDANPVHWVATPLHLYGPSIG
jgi:hypothetical protein